MLELREVEHFDESASGWSKWHESKLRYLRAVEFGFFEDDEEVARARIYPEYPLDSPYEGLRPGLFVDIDLLVVRDHRRCEGFGLEAVALLGSRYQGQEMIAFSAADRFWAKAGWVPAVRRDGDELAMTLFVH